MANKFPLILNTSANQIQEIASGDNLDLTGCKIVGLQGINSAGIVTFTKAHVGAATTWGEDLVVTGNARVTGILTVGTNSVTISGNDVNITGITTASNFKTGTSNLHNVGLEIAGINVLGADTPIGTGATIYDAGGAVFTGVVTATNYVGTINTPAQPNITSLGTLSALNVSGALSGTTATFSGNVSIGGTLTYEDVTNIDSVGLITARNGINIQDDATFTGATTNMVWDKSDSKLKFNNILNIYNKDGSSRIEGASGGMFFKATGAYVWSNNSLSTRFEALDSSCILYASGSKIARSRPGELQIGNPDAGIGIGVTIGINGNAVFGGTGIVTATTFQGEAVKPVANSGSVKLYHNTAIKLETSSSGVNFGTGASDILSIQGQTLFRNGNNGSGIHFTTGAIYPTNNSGANNNGATNLGGTSNKFGTLFSTFVKSDRVDCDGQLHVTYPNGTNTNYLSSLSNNNGMMHLFRGDGLYIGNNMNTSNQASGPNNKAITLGTNGNITATGNVSAGQLTSKSLTLTDNGASGPILNVRTDDNAPWAVSIGNDTYHTGKGLHFYQENNGDMYQKLFGNSAYVNYFIQQSDSSTTQNVIKIGANRDVTLYYQGSSRLYTADASSTSIGCVVENGSLEVKHTNDWQLRVHGTDGWAGIQFKDNNNADNLWYNGSNSTFTIGGGGSNVAGKKLHIDGGTTIGSTIDTHTPPTNGLKVQGPINVGSGSADNDMSKFTNGDSGNHEYSHLGNNTRLLHSNGTGWDGHTHSDGCDPILICSSGDRAGNSDRGDSAGLMLHTNSDDDGDYSPLIGFSARSNSGSYNSMHAAIMAKKKGQAADHNWNAGQLEFYTAGKESNRASDQYMDNIPDFFINRRGYTGTPRHPRFQAYKSGSNWTVSQNADLVWDNTVYNIGNCYNTGNGRFTAPCDGFYHFTAYSITYGTYTNNAWYVRVNNNRVNGGDTHFSTHGSNWEHLGWSGVYKLTAGQYVSIQTNSTVTYHGGSWSGFYGYLVSSESW